MGPDGSVQPVPLRRSLEPVSSTPTLVSPILSPSRIRLDDEMLKELGFDDLSPAARADLLEFLRSKLEMAVGERLADDITSREMSDLGAIIDSENSSPALIYLDRVCPEHPAIVREEFERLAEQLEAERPAFLAAFGVSEKSA